MPLSTLRLTPRGVNRKTQGQDGVRSLLSCRALSSPTTCRLIPAHPQSVFEVATRTLTTSRVPLKKSKLCDLFLAGIRCTDGKRQQLACLGVRFRSGVTKEQRRPQVKSHAGGSLAARQDPDFFFDRNAHLGANRGIFAFASSDGNDFAWFAHGRF